MQKLLPAIFVILCGCTSITIPPEYIRKDIQTSTFKLAVWQKVSSPNIPFKFYIEGDGYAFNSYGRVSTNPTPKGTLLREIAFGDSHPNVIYIARPCQFVKDDMCSPRYWSVDRFAPEVITAVSEVVQQYSLDSSITLVGYSGGAQVAGLVAVKNPDMNISKLVTIAGNLDVKGWTNHHHLTPLNLDYGLDKYRENYLKIPQVHYVGNKDDVIPPFLTVDFINDKNKIKFIKKASHHSGWQNVYEQIRAE